LPCKSNRSPSRSGPPPGVVGGPHSGGPPLSWLLNGGFKKTKKQQGTERICLYPSSISGWVGAKRNPSSLFAAVIHVSLGLLRVLRRQKTRLRVKDCLFENRSRSLIIGSASSRWDLQREKISSGTNPQCSSRSFGGQVDALIRVFNNCILADCSYYKRRSGFRNRST